LFKKSNTTGEKEIEEFFTENDEIKMNEYKNVGIIKNNQEKNISALNDFETSINELKSNMAWDKKSIIDEFKKLIQDFNYNDKKKYLEGKM